MDWFERLTGFQETTYEETKRRLSVVDGRLRSDAKQRSYAVGVLELPALSELRTRAQAIGRQGRLRLSIVEGDVRALHQMPDNRGALFQVASQFNLLEMVGPDVTPEDGVTGYAHDGTQGPACAMAAGAATIYRNYLVPIADEAGQTADRQLDALADLGLELARRLGTSMSALWRMQNGYALAKEAGLSAISMHLRVADAATLDALRGLLRIGVHWDVEATDARGPGPLVTQAFCSALPVAYSNIASSAWEPFARLVLEAAYEATLLASLLNSARGGTNRVLLTRLGGGAFGNEDAWIDDAILRACRLMIAADLDVSIVSHGPPSKKLRDLLHRLRNLTAVD
ncbi:conserved hypothetical protein [Methylobacterium sp. 4-46]|uniref:hypothetical protein n=1 Tax=unclassified Methylobacterium TaxID=2615210 RepID=UPI000165C8E8|nr:MULTISPECIES: hypothetical protein [Methylobacterium]ACA16009.1 conserved hypothetical protein [Methylobacterium sp. 4-46]WFT81723.1 hypothetical protein QA634_07630 [Methylobacterium nodulans]